MGPDILADTMRLQRYECVRAHEAAVLRPDGSLTVWGSDLCGRDARVLRTSRDMRNLVSTDITECCSTMFGWQGHYVMAHGFLTPSMRSLLRTIRSQSPCPDRIYVCMPQENRNAGSYLEQIRAVYPHVALELRQSPGAVQRIAIGCDILHTG